ncbi:MAG: hypothetical protein AAF633_01510 [Chloroflexota bacterium]
MWAFLSDIRSHPIYGRQRGRWGEVNSYYKRITSYLWLLIFAFPVLFITNAITPFSIFGSQEYGFLFLTTCLPGLVVQLITWIGLISAPAMTAPAIVEEIQGGSWDILRLTPMPVHEIVIAKFLGGLSYLKIWVPLLLVSILQAILFFLGLSASFVGFDQPNPIPLILAGASILLRPWLEITFAGIVGITISMWATSVRGALVSSYAIILLFKFILSNIASVVVLVMFSEFGFDALGTAISFSLPLLLYSGAIMLAVLIIVQRSNYLGRI